MRALQHRRPSKAPLAREPPHPRIQALDLQAAAACRLRAALSCGQDCRRGSGMQHGRHESSAPATGSWGGAAKGCCAQAYARAWVVAAHLHDGVGWVQACNAVERVEPRVDVAVPVAAAAEGWWGGDSSALERRPNHQQPLRPHAGAGSSPAGAAVDGHLVGVAAGILRAGGRRGVRRLVVAPARLPASACCGGAAAAAWLTDGPPKKEALPSYHALNGEACWAAACWAAAAASSSSTAAASEGRRGVAMGAAGLLVDLGC